MLKEKVISLLDRYEGCEEWLSATDVQKELEDLLANEPYEFGNLDFEMALRNAANNFAAAQSEARLCGGRAADGGDLFIEELERIVEY